MKLQELIELRESIQIILGQIVRIVYYIKKQQFHQGFKLEINLWMLLTELVDKLKLNHYLDDINSDEPVLDMEWLLTVFQEIQEAQEQEDYVLLSDLYQLRLMPMLVSVQERLVSALGIQIDETLLSKNISYCNKKYPQLLYSLLPEFVIRECIENDIFSDEAMEEVVAIVEKCFQKGYSVEPTSCGMMTMAVDFGKKFYIHSNGQIVEEALIQAEEWLSQQKEEYVFYGLGMGYPYIEMLALDKNISVQVMEMNREMLILALVFAPLYMLFQYQNFSLLYDPTGNKLKNMDLGINNRSGFYILKPALHGIRNSYLRERLECYFVEESSVRAQERSLMGCFKKNVKVQAGNIDDLKERFADRKIVIVAAGPSLDGNLADLKEKREDTIVLAAGTVLKKMLQAGIAPDYVIIIDSGESTYLQITGVEDCGVPLIFLSTVFSWIPRDYKGEKFILYQKGFEPAEEMALKRDCQMVESGGSVMTTALDLCLRLSVKAIIFIGLDLALKDGLDHTTGTVLRNKIVRDTGIWVPGVKEERVQTTRNLQLYLQWMVGRLARKSDAEKRIPVVDATEGGARKEGMSVETLKEALKM